MEDVDDKADVWEELAAQIEDGKEVFAPRTRSGKEARDRQNREKEVEGL